MLVDESASGDCTGGGDDASDDDNDGPRLRLPLVSIAALSSLTEGGLDDVGCAPRREPRVLAARDSDGDFNDPVELDGDKVGGGGGVAKHCTNE